MASGGELLKKQTFTPPKDAPDYLVDALGDIGLQEWVMSGRKKASNPAVERYINKVEGHPLSAIETPWCAYFVGAKLEYHNYPSTKSGMARSYLKWGQAVDLEQAKVGDVVVFWRGSPTSSSGHVAFFLQQDDEYVYVLGGNQGDKVSIAQFNKDKVVGVRRYKSLWASKINLSGAGQVAGGATLAVAEVVKSAPPVETAEAAKTLFEQVMEYFPNYKIMLGVAILALGLYVIYRRNYEHKESGK